MTYLKKKKRYMKAHLAFIKNMPFYESCVIGTFWHTMWWQIDNWLWIKIHFQSCIKDEFAIGKICFSIKFVLYFPTFVTIVYLTRVDHQYHDDVPVYQNQVTICMHRVTSCCTSSNPRQTRPPCRKFRPRDLRDSGRTGVRYISRGPSRWGKNCTRETWRRSPCPRGRLYVLECTCDARRVRRRTPSLRVVCNVMNDF